jgi:hypothetical protein
MSYEAKGTTTVQSQSRTHGYRRVPAVGSNALMTLVSRVEAFEIRAALLPHSADSSCWKPSMDAPCHARLRGAAEVQYLAAESEA